MNPLLPRDEDGKLSTYTWPGGYPFYYITADSGALCAACARMAEEEGLTGDVDDPQWNIIAADINYEGEVYCGHCNEEVAPAYD